MRRRTSRKLYNFILFLVVCSVMMWVFSYIDNRFMPVLKEVSHIHCKAYANKIINSSLNEILMKKELNADEFLFYDTSEGRYTTNTILINQFCTMLSETIAASLSELPNEEISVPFGAVFGVSLLADNGPEITFTLYPAGNVAANYKSEFIAAGINQVNYKIWLDISVEMKIVNPLYNENLKLTRKVLLTDIIFNGKVPEYYFQMSSPDEYLLTE